MKDLDPTSGSAAGTCSVVGCGRNDVGQLGIGDLENSIGTEITSLADRGVRLVGSGPSARSAFFATDDGEVYATGLNDKGQLGVGDTDNRSVRVLCQVETVSPSLSPTVSPSLSPTVSPSLNPTVSPSLSPTVRHSLSPTVSPSLSPTVSP